MKKVLFTLATVCGLAFASQAQETRVGLKAGVNISTIGGDETDGVDPTIGFHIGGVASVGLTESVSFMPEVVFSTQGAKEEDSDGTYTLNTSYINVPLMVNVVLTEGLNLQFGPQIGILMAAKTKVEMGGEEIDIDVKDEFSTLDLGLGLGLAYQLESGLNIGARYNYGLSNIYDSEENFSQNNQVIQVSLGYFLQ